MTGFFLPTADAAGADQGEAPASPCEPDLGPSEAPSPGRPDAEKVPEPPSLAHAQGPAVCDLARQWLDEHVAVRCKANTVRMYTVTVKRQLLPAFGKMPGAGARPCEGDGNPSLPAGDTGDGEPGGRHPCAHLERGGGPEADAGGEQPVPAGGDEQGTPTRTVPLRGGVPPPRAHARRGGDPHGRFDPRRCRDPAAAAHRLPADRDPDAALAGRGTGGARTGSR